MVEEYKLVLLKNGEKVFEAMLQAEIRPYGRIIYDESSFKFSTVEEEYRDSIKMLIEAFLELWEEVDSDG